MLLKEFLKEHRKVKKLEATVAQQDNAFETRIAELKEEIDVKIEKVSARVEMDRHTTKVIVDKP